MMLKTVPVKLLISRVMLGGYPTLDGGTMSKDSDLDGIPNEYEDKNGLDKNSSSDAVKINPSTGYMYIEEYANALADGSYVREYCL